VTEHGGGQQFASDGRLLEALLEEHQQVCPLSQHEPCTVQVKERFSRAYTLSLHEGV
jgi:hypothetical protein